MHCERGSAAILAHIGATVGLSEPAGAELVAVAEVGPEERSVYEIQGAGEPAVVCQLLDIGDRSSEIVDIAKCIEGERALVSCGRRALRNVGNIARVAVIGVSRGYLRAAPNEIKRPGRLRRHRHKRAAQRGNRKHESHDVTP